MNQTTLNRRLAKDVGQAHRESSEDRNPSYKRRRIALACTSCRSRKSRCNGAKPSCSLCIQLGFECIYEQPANPQSQSSVRRDDGHEDRLKSIEDTLQLLISQQNQLQRLQTISRNEMYRVPTRNHSRIESQDFAILGGDDETVIQDLNEDRVDGLATIADTDKNDPRYFGPSSNIALLGDISRMVSRISKSRPQHQHGFNGGSEQRLVSRMQSPNHSVSGATPATPVHFNPCTLPSETETIAMIEHFFSDTGMLYPYLSKHYITSSYEQARTRNFSGVKRSWICLLNMIFAFATFTTSSQGQPLEKSILTSKVYFNRAQELLAESKLRLADLDLVQCLLLMSQYRQGTQRSDETWSLHALAVHSATQIGLHCPPNSTKSSPFEIEIRKRTWYGCVVLDSTLSMTLGRPPSIPKEYTILDLPQNIDLDDLQSGDAHIGGRDHSEQGNTVCFFIATIELYRVQHEIIIRLYQNNLCDEISSDRERLAIDVMKIEQMLTQWEFKLHPQLTLKPWEGMITNNTIFERLSVIIRLRFLHARLLAHRTMLRTLSKHFSDPDGRAEAMDSFLTKMSRESMLSCASTACEIVNIVHRMSAAPLKLGAWWFSIYYTFHAALTIMACLIYHFEANSVNVCVKAPFWSNADLKNLALSLPKGKEAIDRIGQGTRSSRRICKTLTRMIEICATVARSNPNDSSAILTALGYPNSMRGLRPNGQGDVIQASTPDAGIFDVDEIGEHSDLFSTDMPNFWLQSDSDIFANLGGLDVGLSSIMA